MLDLMTPTRRACIATALVLLVAAPIAAAARPIEVACGLEGGLGDGFVRTLTEEGQDYIIGPSPTSNVVGDLEILCFDFNTVPEPALTFTLSVEPTQSVGTSAIVGQSCAILVVERFTNQWIFDHTSAPQHPSPPPSGHLVKCSYEPLTSNFVAGRTYRLSTSVTETWEWNTGQQVPGDVNYNFRSRLQFSYATEDDANQHVCVQVVAPMCTIGPLQQA